MSAMLPAYNFHSKVILIYSNIFYLQVTLSKKLINELKKKTKKTTTEPLLIEI